MCGRYDLDATAEELAARFGVPLRDVSVPVAAGVTAHVNNVIVGWRPRYNIAPRQHNPVVMRDGSGHGQLELMQWGLVPAWSREARVAYSTINARAETVASKPAFRKPLATQRCLVPATGYFEWAQLNKMNREKQPYRIGLRSESTHGAKGTEALEGPDEIFAFAGLYE